MEFIIALLVVLFVVWCIKWAPTIKAAPQDNKYEKQKKIKAEIIDKSALPLSLTSQLLEKENVYYFSYLIVEANDGGCCGTNSRSDFWISLTDKRIIYKAKIREDNNTKFFEKNGVIPFDKISSIEITYSRENSGCSNTESYELIIGSSGSKIIIPIPTEEKGFEIRKIYMEILEILKKKDEDDDKHVE